jgi:hypothetical protein
MWYFLPEWLKFWKKWKASPPPEDLAISEIIRKRAEEQNAVIERKAEVNIDDIKSQKVAEKDFFE